MERPLDPSTGAPPWAPTETTSTRRFVAILVGLTFFAFLVRIPLFDYESGDYRVALSVWYDHIAEHGFSAFGERFSDYTPTYLYLLALATHLPFSKLVNIKLIELPFDVLLAVAVMLIVRERFPSRLAQGVAYALVLFLPTVVWNGAMWGQCDAIFTSFTVLGVLFLLRQRPWLAVLMLGVGFAFKGQALFVAPAFVFLTLKGRIPLPAWLLFPVPYLVAIFPSWLAGRPFWELVNIYRDQADLYQRLVLGLPNLYQWLPNAAFLREQSFRMSAVIILAAILIALLVRLHPGPREIVALATFFAVYCPFFMPRMHDRYYFIADVLSIAYAFFLPRSWYLPLLIVPVSLYAYWPYLHGTTPIHLKVLTGIAVLALLKMLYDLWQLSREAPADEPLLRLRLLPKFALTVR